MLILSDNFTKRSLYMTLQYINFDTTLISDLTDELRTYLLQKYDKSNSKVKNK